MSDLSEMKPFWMIQGIGQGGYSIGPPTVRHATQEEALTEAERLARTSPGSTFVVLESVAAVRKRDIDICRMGRGLAALDDDIPF